MLKLALVLGAGGFIGGHLVSQLKREGFWVRGVDLKFPEFREVEADDFLVGDLRDPLICREAVDRKYDEVYQLAADMGGAGYIFTGEHDADVMHNSATINLNVLEACRRRNNSYIFYSSSACMYPAYNQEDPDNPNCAEIPLILQRPTANTGGKSYLARGSIWLITAIMGCMCESVDFIIFLARKGPGLADARRLRQQFAGRLHRQRPEESSRCGVMGTKPGRFSMWTNAWKG